MVARLGLNARWVLFPALYAASTVPVLFASMFVMARAGALHHLRHCVWLYAGALRPAFYLRPNDPPV
jgi:hypothetical protein